MIVDNALPPSEQKYTGKSPKVLKPFSLLSSDEKKERILDWIAPLRTNNNEIKVQEISKTLPHALIDDMIDLSIVRPHFNRGTFMVLLFKIKRMREEANIACALCDLSLSLHTKSIGCDHCLKWFHAGCVIPDGIPPKHQFWFCNRCLYE